MDIGIGTICHPPYIRLLEDHLTSIENAVSQREIQIYLFCSQMSLEDNLRVKKILENHPKTNFELTQEKITIGAARNRLFTMSNSEWMLFLDSDVELVANYFSELELFFELHNLKDVWGIAGGIGLHKASLWGRYEGLMDLNALVGKIEKLDTRIYEDIFEKFYVNKSERDLWISLNNQLRRFDGSRIKYMQGFNQIIHRDQFLIGGGFDNSFMSAEDRDIAACIYSHGKEVLFAPASLALHSYDLTFKQIMHRKMIHGIWSAKFRKKYKNHPKIVNQYEFNDWANYALSTLNPPKMFQSLIGKIYYTSAFISYAYGGLLGSLNDS